MFSLLCNEEKESGEISLCFVFLKLNLQIDKNALLRCPMYSRDVKISGI